MGGFMTYAHRKDIYYADTHMMERPDWLSDFADQNMKDRLEQRDLLAPLFLDYELTVM